MPARPPDGTLTWHISPDHGPAVSDYVYIDGSGFNTNAHQFVRFGHATIVVCPDGQLGGLGRGVPPDWVDSSAAPELWQLFERSQQLLL